MRGARVRYGLFISQWPSRCSWSLSLPRKQAILVPTARRSGQRRLFFKSISPIFF